ncbi:MAG: tetratricopeptide repeat protein [Myxococcota bacterium]
MRVYTAVHGVAWCIGMLAIVLLLFGCGRQEERYRWERALLAADRLADHRDYQAAREAYIYLSSGEMAEHARQAELRYVQYRLAYLYEREGNYRDAILGYQELWSGDIRDETAAKAMYRVGYIFYAPLGRHEDGLDTWERVMVSMPETIAAGKALREILSHYDREGAPRQALDFIERLYPRLFDTPIGDNLMYRYGQRLRALGAYAAAEAAYRRVIDVHAASGLVDDAQWELAELYQTQERFTDALLILRFITENRESSWIVGTYDSEYVDDARFQRGIIYLDRLNAHAKAEREFARFLDEFPESLLRDDARWNIIQSRLARNDAQGARSGCNELTRIEPESRWVDDCQQLIAALAKGASPGSLRQEGAD